jgi:nucleoside-diphosphate-sugar epimerase
MSKLTRIIILGHSGFIGANLERQLQGIFPADAVLGRSLPEMDLTNLESARQLIPFLGQETAIVLCAAVKRQFGDTLEVYLKNMAIVENVAQIVAEHPVARLLFMSSAAVYGEETHNLAIDEETPVNPTSFYGMAKFTGECMLRRLVGNLGKTGLVFLRPPLIYGPGDKGRTYGPSGFSAAVKEGQPITLWGDGTELREFIYMEDLCRLILHLLEHSFTGPVNIVSGQRYCFADILGALRQLGYSPEVHMRERSKQKADNAFIPTRLQTLLPSGFQFTPLVTGLQHLLKH